MYSKAKILGHSIHPMLVHFPIAFYAATALAYGVYAGTGNHFWFQFGVIANIAGVASAAMAAIPGLIDWLGIPNKHPAKDTGAQHMGLNVSALLLFAISAFLESRQWTDLQPTCIIAFALSVLGLTLTVGAGILGAKLVDRHHVGVQLTPEQERIDILSNATNHHASSPSIRHG